MSDTPTRSADASASPISEQPILPVPQWVRDHIVRFLQAENAALGFKFDREADISRVASGESDRSLMVQAFAKIAASPNDPKLCECENDARRGIATMCFACTGPVGEEQQPPVAQQNFVVNGLHCEGDTATGVRMMPAQDLVKPVSSDQQAVTVAQEDREACGLAWFQMACVQEMVISVLGVTRDRFDLSPNAMLVDDLGADSLDMVEIQTYFEERGFAAPDEVFTNHARLIDLAALVTSEGATC